MEISKRIYDWMSLALIVLMLFFLFVTLPNALIQVQNSGKPFWIQFITLYCWIVAIGIVGMAGYFFYVQEIKPRVNGSIK